MVAVDFEYDGQFLSDFGFMICNFDSSDMTTVSNGSTLTLNTVPINNGSQFLLTHSKYDECISSTFCICKNVCDYKRDDLEISVDENGSIMRWLNRKTFHKFKIVDDDYSDIYFESTFNISRIVIGGKLLGYELQMLTNSPFGYKEPIEHSFTISSKDDLNIIIDTSNEIGFIYPEMEITILQNGDLTITNEIENRHTVITGCKSGEVLKLKYPVIESNIASHDIMNCFNYRFFRIANTYTEKVNRIYFSLPCKVVLHYSPIRKVVI